MQFASKNRSILELTSLVEISKILIGASIVWSTLYVCMGLFFSAIFPFLYTVLMSSTLFIYNKKRIADQKFIFLCLAYILLLPCFVQLSFGSYYLSGGVVMWAMLAPAGSLLFQNQNRFVAWLLAFLSCLTFSWIYEVIFQVQHLFNTAIYTILLLLNIVGIASVLLYGLYFFVRKKLVSDTHINSLQASKAETLERLKLKNNELKTSFKERGVLLNTLIDQKHVLKVNEQRLQDSLLKEQELGQLKTSFVSTASHQFRTPLAGIKSNSELLQLLSNKLDVETSERFKKVIGRITGEIARMTELMDDVLILGKLTSSNVHYTPKELDVTDFCEQLANQFNEVTTDGRVVDVVTEGEPYTMKLDHKLLTHAASNLINNAFKYSLGKENPELAIHFKPKELVLAIKDYGMGIPKDEMSNLFQPFFRAQNVLEIKGTGLGLSIAKEYVEINKGQITATSILGEGSCFEITFKR